MQIYTQLQQNSYIIALNGELNAESAGTVPNAMLEALQYNPKEVMVDCEALEEVSHKSLKSFISTVRSMQNNQLDLVLISVNHRLHKLFSCAGIDALTNQVTSSRLISDNGPTDIYFRRF